MRQFSFGTGNQALKYKIRIVILGFFSLVGWAVSSVVAESLCNIIDQIFIGIPFLYLSFSKITWSNPSFSLYGGEVAVRDEDMDSKDPFKYYSMQVTVQNEAILCLS